MSHIEWVCIIVFVVFYGMYLIFKKMDTPSAKEAKKSHDRLFAPHPQNSRDVMSIGEWKITEDQASAKTTDEFIEATHKKWQPTPSNPRPYVYTPQHSVVEHSIETNEIVTPRKKSNSTMPRYKKNTQQDANNMLVFKVRGSAEEPYVITVTRGETIQRRSVLIKIEITENGVSYGDSKYANVTMHCTCRAGQGRWQCKHRMNLLNGDTTALIDWREEDIITLKEMLEDSDVNSALSNYEEASESLAELQSHFKKLKKDKTISQQELEDFKEEVDLAKQFLHDQKINLAISMND